MPKTPEGGGAHKLGGEQMISPKNGGSVDAIDQFWGECSSKALVRRFGKPTLLITFTCNIQWPEIQNSLYAGESAYDRPDICTRVFKQKLNLLMNYLLKKQVLGPSTYYLYTIEQQKRKCLHHAHIILGLEDTARTPDEIDYFC